MTVTLSAVCSKVKAGIDADKPPHLVVDATLSGTSSEIAKSVSKMLAIPTISGSSGDPGDIRYTKPARAVA